jgi:ethanolamine utilization protein EutA
MAENAGKFVAATADTNLESVLSCHGSGITDFSLVNKKAILHTDIGGGTSNIALAKNGLIVSTACINVGGRLITFDKAGFLDKIENAAKITADEIGITLKLGKKPERKLIVKLCDKLSDCLFEILFSTPPFTSLIQKLLMTNPLFEDSYHKIPFNAISFSGGVAEFLYNIKNNNNEFNDIGRHLALSIIKKLNNHEIELYSPKETIRATVIGAGQYSMEVSGSTTFISPSSSFPLKNIPVISPYIDKSRFSQDLVIQSIKRAYQRLDTNEGEQIVVLSFKNPVAMVYDKIKEFVLALEKSLPNTIEKNLPLILLFDSDIEKSVGKILKIETSIKSDVISIDEIDVREGEFIDIGKPIITNNVVPVIIKSLVFN